MIATVFFKCGGTKNSVMGQGSIRALMRPNEIAFGSNFGHLSFK